jgi:hypothetical protein
MGVSPCHTSEDIPASIARVVVITGTHYEPVTEVRGPLGTVTETIA